MQGAADVRTSAAAKCDGLPRGRKGGAGQGVTARVHLQAGSWQAATGDPLPWDVRGCHYCWLLAAGCWSSSRRAECASLAQFLHKQLQRSLLTWKVAAMPRFPTSMMLHSPLAEPTSSCALQAGCHASSDGATHGMASSGRSVLRTSYTCRRE